VHPATVSLLCWFADCWLHCRFQQDTKLSHDCWDSSRSAKISDSGSSANTNGNPTYDFGMWKQNQKIANSFLSCLNLFHMVTINLFIIFTYKVITAEVYYRASWINGRLHTSSIVHESVWVTVRLFDHDRLIIGCMYRSLPHHYQLSVSSETIRNPPLVKAQTAFRKQKIKYGEKRFSIMADGILKPCNVACGSGIITVNSPSGSRPT